MVQQVPDHSWNLRWDLVQCNISSHLQIRHTPAVHVTEPVPDFPFPAPPVTLHTSFPHFFKGRNEAKTFCVKKKHYKAEDKL